MIDLDNCWFLVPKEDLSKSGALLVTTYNQALLTRNFNLTIAHLNILNGLEEYSGPTNIRVKERLPNGARLAWDIPETSSCYRRAKIVIALYFGNGQPRMIEVKGESNSVDIMGLNPDKAYTVLLNIGYEGTKLAAIPYTFNTETAVHGWIASGVIGSADGSFAIPQVDGKSEDISAGKTLFTATASVGTATYQLIDDAGGIGTIDPTSGVVSLAAGQTLDFETASTLIFKIKASIRSSFGTATITLTIIDVNEAPAYVNTQATKCVVDNSVADTFIGTYTATDQDACDIIAYSIFSGNTKADFAYMSEGKLKVATNKTLDQSTTATYTLVLHATDDDSTSLTVSSTVTVNVQSTCNGMGAFSAITPSVLLAAIVFYII